MNFEALFFTNESVLVTLIILLGLKGILLKGLGNSFRLGDCLLSLSLIFSGLGVLLGNFSIWGDIANWFLIVIASLFLIIRFVKERPQFSQETLTAPMRSVLILFIGVISIALLINLGSYSPLLHTWESTVLEGFGEAFVRNLPLLDYLRSSLAWDDGVLSAGHTSIGYGVPTYAILQYFGFNAVNLRLTSVILSILSIIALFDLVRAFFGAKAGLAAAFVFATSEAFAFYSRYGSSTSSSLFFAIVSLRLVLTMIENKRSWLFIPSLAAAVLFLATLNYSPIRLLVIVLTGVAAVSFLIECFKLKASALRYLIFFSLLASAYYFEVRINRAHYFLNARGEQIFTMAKDHRFVNELAGEEFAKIFNYPAPTLSQWFQIMSTLISSRTGPEYLKLASPLSCTECSSCKIHREPPPVKLGSPALFPFILWGILYCVWTRSPQGLTLLIWTLFASGTVLLTNRADAHRLLLLTIPWAIWAGIGFSEFTRTFKNHAWRKATLMSVPLLILGIALFAEFLRELSCAPMLTPNEVSLLREEIAQSEAPIAFGALFDHRMMDTLLLDILERRRADPEWKGALLSRRLREQTRDSELSRYPAALRDLKRIIDDGTTLLLAPTEYYFQVRRIFQEQGYKVTSTDKDGVSFFSVSLGLSHSALEEKVKIAEGFQPLSSWRPIPATFESGSASYSFAAPQTNRSWDGSALRINGILFEYGIGAHARTEISFEIPKDAIHFSARVGITAKSSCENASAIVSISSLESGVLATSPVLDLSYSSPVLLTTSVSGNSTIKMIIEDAGDGIDCDHVGIGEPTFWIK